MSDQNSAAQGRAAADQILDRMSDEGLQNDPNATLRDAGGEGEDVSGYALPVIPPRVIGGVPGVETAPPYAEPDPPEGGGDPPEPTPPYSEGGGQKPAVDDNAKW